MKSYAASLPYAMPIGTPNTVFGTHYLLGQAPWGEFVGTYSEAEFAQVFTSDERKRLAAGEQVWRGKGLWTDMVAATRAAVKLTRHT